jgi:hypothetical protein
MTVRRQAYHRAIAKHIMLAIDETQLVTELEIAWIEAVRTRDVRGRAGVPFTALHNHRGVWDQLIPAAMVEMEMRVDDEVDLRRVAVARGEAR